MGPHVGDVHQCLHKREPCGFSTFFNVSVATNVTAREARVTSQNELSVIATVGLLACNSKPLTKKGISCPNQDASLH